MINQLRKRTLLLIMCLSPVFVGRVHADTITIMGEYHPPLNGYPDEKNPGFMVDIANLIFTKHGHQIRYILGPRMRGVKMAKEGKINCVVNAKIMEHGALEFPTEPWGYHAATLFALSSSNFEYKGIEQLNDISLGATASERYDNGPLDEYLTSKGSNVSLSYGKNALERQIRKLVKGRVDSIVSCPLVMRGQLREMNVNEDLLKIVGEVKPFVGMYFACGRKNRKNKEYISIINKEIPLIRENGQLKRILDKYGQTDWIDIHNKLKKKSDTLH